MDAVIREFRRTRKEVDLPGVGLYRVWVEAKSGGIESAEDVLHRLWKWLSGSGDRDLVNGVILGLHLAGRIDDAVALHWLKRMEVCPGHDGGQTWCSFCGDVCRKCDKNPIKCGCPTDD